MAIVKDVIEGLKKLDPNDVIHINWVSKENVVDELVAKEMSDENDVLYEQDRLEQLVDNDFMQRVNDQLNNDDLIWEKFYESLDEILSDEISATLKDIQEVEADRELWGDN